MTRSSLSQWNSGEDPWYDGVCNTAKSRGWALFWGQTLFCETRVMGIKLIHTLWIDVMYHIVPWLHTTRQIFLIMWIQFNGAVNNRKQNKLSKLTFIKSGAHTY